MFPNPAIANFLSSASPSISTRSIVFSANLPPPPSGNLPLFPDRSTLNNNNIDNVVTTTTRGRQTMSVREDRNTELQVRVKYKIQCTTGCPEKNSHI